MTENAFLPGSERDPARKAEETLRLVAQLAPPEDLTEGVHRRLAMEEMSQESSASRGFWSLWMPARRLQFAAAAVLAVAVAGSMWSVYRGWSGTGWNGAGKSGAPAAGSVPAANPGTGGSGFGSADARRVPPTLNPIKVPPVPKKKPGAGHAAQKHAIKPQTDQPAGGTPNP